MAFRLRKKMYMVIKNASFHHVQSRLGSVTLLGSGDRQWACFRVPVLHIGLCTRGKDSNDSYFIIIIIFSYWNTVRGISNHKINLVAKHKYLSLSIYSSNIVMSSLWWWSYDDGNESVGDGDNANRCSDTTVAAATDVSRLVMMIMAMVMMEIKISDDNIRVPGRNRVAEYHSLSWNQNDARRWDDNNFTIFEKEPPWKGIRNHLSHLLFAFPVSYYGDKCYAIFALQNRRLCFQFG